MYSFVQYCRLPYHLQDDDSKSLKCALINSVIGGLVAFLVGIFAMSLKMDIKLALYIAIPLSILSTIAVYLQHTIMRKRGRVNNQRLAIVASIMNLFNDLRFIITLKTANLTS